MGTSLAPDSELTTPGTIIGTVHYMAPEQLEGLPTDARTDLFAFGCVLYEMLSGRKAFEGRSGASLMTAIMAQRTDTASRARPVAAERRRTGHRAMPGEESR